MTATKHGAQRNRRQEVKHGPVVQYTTQDGHVVHDGPSCSSERSAAEIWCEFCHAWVSTTEMPWLMGFICCPRCKHDWSDVPPLPASTYRVLSCGRTIAHSLTLEQAKNYLRHCQGATAEREVQTCT